MAELTVNGRALQIDEADLDPHTTLLDFLRDRGLVGTKEGCAEGECGACAVALVRPDAETGGSSYVAINSCLTLVGSVLGGEVISVEGVELGEGSPHPVQVAMAEGGGRMTEGTSRPRTRPSQTTITVTPKIAGTAKRTQRSRGRVRASQLLRK